MTPLFISKYWVVYNHKETDMFYGLMKTKVKISNDELTKLRGDHFNAVLFEILQKDRQGFGVEWAVVLDEDGTVLATVEREEFANTFEVQGSREDGEMKVSIDTEHTLSINYTERFSLESFK